MTRNLSTRPDAHDDAEHDPSIALENSLNGVAVDLLHLSESNQSAQKVADYLSERKLGITDFVGAVVNGHSDAAVDAASQCIKAIVKSVGISNVGENGLLTEGLAHPLPRVKLLVLRLLQQEEGNIELKLRLAPLIIDCLESDDLRVATAASTLITSLSSAALPALLTEEVVSQLTSLFESSKDTVSLRITELIISIATTNPSQTFPSLETSGLLDTVLLDPLDSRDILARLNTLQLLTQLPKSPEGFQLLERTGILRRVAGYMHPPPDNVDLDTQLSQSAAIKFYAQAALVRSDALEIMEDTHAFLATLQMLLTSEDTQASWEVREVCLNAVGNVGSSLAGLSLLLRSFPTLLDVLAETAAYGTGLLRVTAVQCLSIVLENESGSSEDVEAGATCLRLFDKMGGSTRVLAMIKGFDDALRVAGYACMKAAVKYEWGLRAVRESGQLVAFLFDRSNETSQVGMHWRFTVIESIATNVSAKNVLPEVLYHRFVKYAKEGAFYSESQPQVMMDSL
ncbi:26S proteasome non-ATPase regulatory subunit 5 [Chytriomyces sp. MP71]|nr:26S proteasome non-ATPase regulatory subunit 5 [Chytriomyces sp. MP71]